MSAQFNAFEEAIDFSFWKELCEKHGKLHHFRRGEYFARTGEVLKNAGWIVSGGFKHSLIDNSGNAKTVGFVFEGSVLANYISSMHGKKMLTDFIALEDSDPPISTSFIVSSIESVKPYQPIPQTQKNRRIKAQKGYFIVQV